MHIIHTARIKLSTYNTCINYVIDITLINVTLAIHIIFIITNHGVASMMGLELTFPVQVGVTGIVA